MMVGARRALTLLGALVLFAGGVTGAFIAGRRSVGMRLTRVDAATWATLGLGAATFILAVATVFLAKYTRRVAERTAELAEHGKAEAQAVERQADATAKLLDATIRPWLTACPPEFIPAARYGRPGVRPEAPEPVDLVRSDERRTLIRLWLRNVGAGLALVVPECVVMRQYAPEEATPGDYQKGLALPAAVARGEATLVKFEFVEEGSRNAILADLLKSGGPPRDIQYLVDVLFTDAGGRQATWARLHVVARAGRIKHEFTHIDYLQDGDGRVPILPTFSSSEIGFI